MTFKNIALLAALSVALLSACAKYEKQYEGAYKDGQSTPTEPVNYEIVYVKDGQIFMASADLKYFKQLPTPIVVDKVSINHAHTRIAYKPVFDENIVVIDTAGNEIEIIPNTQAIYVFDWHANNQTLYMLQGSYIRTHGPAIPLAYEYLHQAHPYVGSDYYYSLTVLPEGDVAFGFGVSGFGTEYIGYRIAYISPGPGHFDHDLPVSGDYPGFIRSSADGQKLFAIAGSTAGTFSSITSGPFAPFAPSVSVGAMSPDGQKFVFWDSFNGSLYLGDGSSTNIGSGNVTDLDW